MFAVKFDDMRRKLLASKKPVELHKLVTVPTGTPEFEAYMGLFLAEDNKTIDILVEDDNKTYTFFTAREIKPAKELNKTEVKL